MPSSASIYGQLIVPSFSIFEIFTTVDAIGFGLAGDLVEKIPSFSGPFVYGLSQSKIFLPSELSHLSAH